jgi:hypothetical protein
MSTDTIRSSTYFDNWEGFFLLIKLYFIDWNLLELIFGEFYTFSFTVCNVMESILQCLILVFKGDIFCFPAEKIDFTLDFILSVPHQQISRQMWDWFSEIISYIFLVVPCPKLRPNEDHFYVGKQK